MVGPVHLTFLGTSAGTPTRDRNVTSQALCFDNGAVWLLDCGEGTQHQIMRAGIKPPRIERVLLTHLHGDHCYGLPGLLGSIAVCGRTEPLRISGPKGVGELVRMTLKLSAATLSYELVIDELEARTTLAAGNRWNVEAVPIVHRVPCFGYVLREDPRPGRFHPEKAKAFGIVAGPLYKRLQEGQTVALDDGRIVMAEMVSDPKRPGRTLVLLGDTNDATAIAGPGANCDLLVCEVTYDSASEAKAVQWGHSTSAMTGRLAEKMRAKNLIITHFSSRYTEDGASFGVPHLVEQTRQYCPKTRVMAAKDLLKVELPGNDDPPA
jgi:ribonuclease Z